MNKSNTILQITSEVLDRYRNSISRKAFIQAMERVIELVLGPGGAPSAGSVPRSAVDPKSGDGQRVPGAAAQRGVPAVSAGKSGL